MRQKIMFFDDRYRLTVNDIVCNRNYARLSMHDTITLEDKYNCLLYRDVYGNKNCTNSLAFLDLAGEIYVAPCNNRYFPETSNTLYEQYIENNYVHVEYDGMTHVTIEDSTYIYQYDMMGYADISVKYESNIFLIIIDNCEKHRIIVVEKAGDYRELLNKSGDSIIIEDNSIIIEKRFKDSLGRIRRSKFAFLEGEYREVNTLFEYTYKPHYNDSILPMLIADAIYSEDYGYIIEHMADNVNEEVLREYFDGILGKSYTLLQAQPLSSTMHFLMTDGVLPYLKNIELYIDEYGKITNFDEVENG